jgi:hypothetical protein
MISLDSLPEALGKFARRVNTSPGGGAPEGSFGWTVWALATGVAVPAQDRSEFESLLKQALAVDPDKDVSNRLATLITQRRARALLDQVEARFTK